MGRNKQPCGRLPSRAERREKGEESFDRGIGSNVGSRRRRLCFCRRSRQSKLNRNCNSSYRRKRGNGGATATEGSDEVDGAYLKVEGKPNHSRVRGADHWGRKDNNYKRFPNPPGRLSFCPSHPDGRRGLANI